MSPPVVAARQVKSLLPGDKPDPKNQPLVSEGHHELDEMPQGALILLTQLQPQREFPLSVPGPGSGLETESTQAGASTDQATYLPVMQPLSEDRHELDEMPQGALMLWTQLQPQPELPLSVAGPGSGSVTDSTLAKASAAQAMHLPVKQPLASSSPAPGNTRLALPATRLLAIAQAQSLIQAPVSNVPAAADRVATDVSLKQKARLSATRLAAAGRAQVPVQIPAPVPVQPSAGAVTQSPAASDQGAVDAVAQQKKPSSAAQLPVAVQAQVSVQAPVASALTAPDQAVADRSVKQEIPQALPAQPLPLPDKVSHSHHATKSAAPAKATPEPKPVPEASIAKEGKNYLQVPFSKGDAVGLITISKAGAERPDQLLLNPSSASVFSHLSDNLAQAPDPRWRLTDQQGYEQRQGHGQGRAEEEAEEESRQALRDRREQGGQQT